MLVFNNRWLPVSCHLFDVFRGSFFGPDRTRSEPTTQLSFVCAWCVPAVTVFTDGVIFVDENKFTFGTQLSLLLLSYKGIVHPKSLIVIIYSPFICFKPVSFSIFRKYLQTKKESQGLEDAYILSKFSVCINNPLKCAFLKKNLVILILLHVQHHQIRWSSGLG